MSAMQAGAQQKIEEILDSSFEITSKRATAIADRIMKSFAAASKESSSIEEVLAEVQPARTPEEQQLAAYRIALVLEIGRAHV